MVSLVLLISLTSCTNTIAVDACSWVKEIRTKNALVRGGAQFNLVLGPPPYSEEALRNVLFFDADILTPGTAGQIVAFNRAVEANCKK